MIFEVRVEGDSPMIQHSVRGMLPDNPVTKEIKSITSKQARHRTESDEERLYELEARNSLWWG